MYEEYSTSYGQACKLLKDKRGVDESFNRFLEMKRGAAMHTLESLMLLPVRLGCTQCVYIGWLVFRFFSFWPKTMDYIKFHIFGLSALITPHWKEL